MLITLEEFKSYIELDTNDDDDTLMILINGVGDFLKTYLGRVIEYTEHIWEYFDGNDIKDCIFLANYPVGTISEFSHTSDPFGDSPEWIDFNTDQYLLDNDKGILYIKATYPGTRNIAVEYDAGYETKDIPAPLKVAALKLTAALYNKKRSDGYSLEEVAGARIQWDKFLTPDIEALIAPYQRVQI